MSNLKSKAKDGKGDSKKSKKTANSKEGNLMDDDDIQDLLSYICKKRLTQDDIEKLTWLIDYEDRSLSLSSMFQRRFEGDDYRDALREAMFIIRRFDVLQRDLACSHKYFHSHSYVTYKFDPLRIFLLQLSENLTKDETLDIAEYFGIQNFEKSDCVVNLWNDVIRLDMITTSKIDELRLPLESMNRMDLINLVDKFKNDVAIKKSDTRSKAPPHFDDAYEFGAANTPGLCIVINIMNFGNKHPKRVGSDKDEEEITRVFESLNFDVDRYKDLSKSRYGDLIRKYSDDNTYKGRSYSMLVVFVLSHGEKNKFLLSDGKSIEIDRLKDIARCSQFRGKAKLFFIQACQGDKTPSTEKEVDADSDYLFAVSSVPNNVSYRSPSSGTWFVQKLCEAIDKGKDRHHLGDILLSVNKRVRQNKGLGDERQMSIIRNITLRRKCFFTREALMA